MKYRHANTQPVPFLKGLEMNEVYNKVLADFPLLKLYFPDYTDDEKPPKNFFWAVFKSVHPKESEVMISSALKQKQQSLE